MAGVPEVMAVAEAREQYAGKWLALEVVSRDRNGMPDKVRVLDQAGSRSELRQKIGAFRHVYVAFAGPVVPPGWAFVFVGAGC